MRRGEEALLETLVVRFPNKGLKVLEEKVTKGSWRVVAWRCSVRRGRRRAGWATRQPITGPVIFFKTIKG